MKKIKSLIVPLVMTITFAIAISCSEQDEVPPVNNNIGSLSHPTLLKTRVSGRVGSELFNSAVGDPLDLTTAKDWTANYQAKNQGGIESHFFGSEIIQQVLNEVGCVGIRIYYALDENGEKKLLIVGVDEAGNDLLPLEGQMMQAGGEGNTIADYSLPCPDYCPE